MEIKKTFTISTYTEHNVGLLNRLFVIFLKRHINIENITVSKSEIEHVNRFTFLVNVTETQIRKIIGQIEKQIEVIRAFYHTEEETIYQELALFKISTEHLHEKSIQNKLKLRRAHVITMTEDYFVIEFSGTKEEIDKLYDRFKSCGLMQFVRSGRIVITRPKMEISKLL